MKPTPTSREDRRTTLWLAPALMVAAVVGLFAVTYAIDRGADESRIGLPTWLNTGGADAARQVLIAIAAAVITVAGVVFSITILALTLASQQFGPRMLRNFIRDRGTQVTLGTFVATFVYSILVLGSVANKRTGDFVPHLSVSVALAMTLISVGVLIYFIDHVATVIQVTSVVSGIARDLQVTVSELFAEAADDEQVEAAGPSVPELLAHLDAEGGIVPAPQSGFLQAVGHRRLVGIGSSSGAVIRLLRRPGHFLVEGRPLAQVWPASAAPDVARALDRHHAVGPHRTLTQDVGFAVDQLVEIAIRALSPAVNDTFTALNCIDWLSAGLCELAARPLPDGVWRDAGGEVRLVEPAVTFERLVKGAHDKIRQAGRGMPAVLIRQLGGLANVIESVTRPEDIEVCLRHAAMIRRAAEESIPEENDRADVAAAYATAVARAGRP